MDCEEYYSRYDNLSNMIIRAYTMLYLIEEIDVPSEPFLSDKFNVIGYVDQILRYMLGLTIWQICYDEDSDANTLQHLHNFIDGNRAKKPKKALGKLREDINCIRNEYLAHNDVKKSGTKISIDDISELLDVLRKWLNSLCHPEFDVRVSEITEDFLKSLKEEINSAMGPLQHKTGDSGEGYKHV